MPFALPDFTRVAWVSDAARRAWADRIRHAARMWWGIEWLSVAAGLRPCAIVRVSPTQLRQLQPRWSELALHAVTLSDAAGALRVGIGAPARVSELRQAWTRRAHDEVGSLLGYPACCREFFTATCIRGGVLDPTWAMARATAGGAGGGEVTVSGDWPANVLWRRLGIRAVPHLPCGFRCAATVGLGERVCRLAESIGCASEAETVRELLSWPVEWSSLHGIAQTKTPILKVSSNTDAAGSKLVIRLSGTRYPEEGATGLAFPYRTRAVPLGRAAAYRRGLDNPVA